MPGTPPAGTSITSGARHVTIINLPAGYAHSHKSLLGNESFALDISAQDSGRDTVFNPDMLLDTGPSTGLCIICCVVMQLIFILKTTAAY
jgi:hypothetical protein